MSEREKIWYNSQHSRDWDEWQRNNVQESKVPLDLSTMWYKNNTQINKFIESNKVTSLQVACDNLLSFYLTWGTGWCMACVKF